LRYRTTKEEIAPSRMLKFKSEALGNISFPVAQLLR
jgi:hypothetical protein